MRKIVCGACKNRYGDSGTWIVFKSAIICESCRLTAIEWMRAMGFSLARPHPFLDELTQTEQTKELIRKYKKK